MTKKITEKRIKWYGHVRRRDEGLRAKKNVRCTSTRKETERKTENQVHGKASVKEIGKVWG